MRKNIFIISILVIISSSLMIACERQPSRYDSLAKCLTADNVTMYGTTWCSHCQNQKALFGSSFDYINFVDCDRHKEECINAGVEGYPTWNINGTNYPGELTFYNISQLSGCQIG